MNTQCLFTVEAAVRIAKEGYANAVRNMTEDDLLDEVSRDSQIGDAIAAAFEAASTSQ